MKIEKNPNDDTDTNRGGVIVNKTGHRKVTEKVFDLWYSINPNKPVGMPGYYSWQHKKVTVAKEVGEVDNYEDLEFVDVEGGVFDHGRDNPHKDEWYYDNDEAHYIYRGRSLTAFNHFIDIKKGQGEFDDYDGYSYRRGSASKDEYQEVQDAVNDPGEKLLAALLSVLTGKDKVDEGINFWFNDEYVHTPGQSWYRGCSPAVERYSFPSRYMGAVAREEEFRRRFPLAESRGKRGKGIPYSIFMPVDNMARYWYARFARTRDPKALGPVMHAIQDVSIPHHAAGYNGNWHARYENNVDANIDNWLNNPDFNKETKELFAQWNRQDNSPPSLLAVNDWSKTPAINWRIDHLVTWVALNAYKAYDQTYNHFRDGYKFNLTSAYKLTQIATTMSMLILCKVDHLW